MNTAQFENAMRQPAPSTLPGSAARIIHALAQKVAMCSRGPKEERSVIATIRRRPRDRQGRNGCHVEFRSAGPPPRAGLQAVHAAGGRALLVEAEAGLTRRLRGQPVVAMQTLSLDEGLMGGWLVTMDLRWPSSVMDDES